MQIPKSDSLSTSTMNRVFDKTSATYKFYWLLSLLDMHVKEQRQEMLALDVASRMVAYAWYPVEYFRLSFGKSDSMAKIIPEVAQLTGITVDDRLDDKADTILQAVHEDRKVLRKVKDLLDNVDLTNHEREAMNVVLQYVKQKVDERFHPDGYNIGINVNEAAGQSVFHCHVHLIPRYKGDVPNPKGGVRGVIPSKQKY